MWDIMIFDKKNPANKIIVKEDSKRYWGADPFLFKYNGTIYLFYERYDCITRKGSLAYRIINKNFTVGPVNVVIEEGSHLSFPFIFEKDEEVYLIPESSSQNCIQVYKADCFPDKWSKHKVIAHNLAAVDTIVLKIENDNTNVWLHTSVGDSCNVENYFLILDNDFNLVKKEKAKSYSGYGNRNAGKIVYEDGKVYRIGQDCTNGEYGKGLVVYDVTNPKQEIELKYLSIFDFEIDKNENYCGVHTYNECGDLSVIDRKYLLKKPWIKRMAFVIRKGIGYILRRVNRDE